MTDLWHPGAPLLDSDEAHALTDLAPAEPTNPDPWSAPVNATDPLDQATEGLRAAHGDLEDAKTDLQAALDRLDLRDAAAMSSLRAGHAVQALERASGGLTSARRWAAAAGILWFAAVVALLLALTSCSSAPDPERACRAAVANSYEQLLASQPGDGKQVDLSAVRDTCAQLTADQVKQIQDEEAGKRADRLAEWGTR